MNDENSIITQDQMQDSQVMQSLIDADGRITLVEEKIFDIEETLLESRQYYNGLIDIQRNNFFTSITVFGALMFSVFLLFVLVNFFLSKRLLKLKIDNEIEDFRREYKEEAEKIVDEVKSDFSENSQQLQDQHDKSFVLMSANQEEALGRLYECAASKKVVQSEYVLQSALCYARALNHRLDLGSVDHQLLKKHIGLMKSMLEQCNVIKDSEAIQELQNAISKLNNVYFVEEKNSLKQILQNKIDGKTTQATVAKAPTIKLETKVLPKTTAKPVAKTTKKAPARKTKSSKKATKS